MTNRPPNQVTLILDAIGAGDPSAAEQLLPLVYGELRRLAASYMQNEKPGNTLDATSLVHEAFIRLLGTADAKWDDRRHFFNAAAMAMRRVLIDRSRAKGTAKRGGDHDRIGLDFVDLPVTKHFALEQAEDLDGALTALQGYNPRWAAALQYRLLLGLTIEQTAETLGVSPATVKNDCRFALAWLRIRLRGEEPDEI